MPGARTAPAHRQGVTPDVADVYRARRRIRALIRRTPLGRSLDLSRLAGADVRIKLDVFQETRSFKLRGTGNAVLALDRARTARGLVTYSTGNHGRAMAYVARRLGLPAVICVSRRVPPAKLAALERLGCERVVEGESQDDAVDCARRLSATRGLFLVDPIDDPNFICGHGTLGIEILEDFPGADTVVVPVSGGALIAGVALAIKAANPCVRIIGVSMDRGAAMHASLAAGKPVQVEEVDSLADSLQGGIGLGNRYTFDMTRALVDDLVLVDETAIGRAIAHAFLRERVVLEGAAAAPLAALLYCDRALFGDRVVLVATGAMIDPGVLRAQVLRHADHVNELAHSSGGRHEP